MPNLTFKTLSPKSQIPLTTPHPLNIAVAGTGYVIMIPEIKTDKTTRIS